MRASSGRERRGRSPREGVDSLVRRPELAKRQVRLLGVVPEDLVVLARSFSRSRLEPVREPFVEVGADRFRDRLVGRVADELVREPERVLRTCLCEFGSMSFLSSSERT